LIPALRNQGFVFGTVCRNADKETR
jgi:hypothetical protein